MAALAQSEIRIAAQPGPQTQFGQSSADIAIYGGSAGGGKALAVDTPIATPCGWTPMGLLEAGDEIFDETGAICRVTVAHPVKAAYRAYRIEFDDGAVIEANAEHLWNTYTAADLSAETRRDPQRMAARRASRPSRATGKRSEAFTASITARNQAAKHEYLPAPSGAIRTTTEIAETLRLKSGRANHAIVVCAPLELPEQDLPIPPYVVGAWLGDGTTVSGGFTSEDPQIIEEIEAEGFTVSSWAARCQFNIIGLQTQLRAAGLLGDKHVPQAYLRGSIGQRLALLQGLMDTDGFCRTSGGCEFTTTRPELRDGMMELLASLGVKGGLIEGRSTLKGIDHGPKWRINFTTALQAFRLARKRERHAKSSIRRTLRYRYIVSCEPIAPKPMRCITVDSPSRLFLAGRAMVPTHNSWALIHEALRNIDVPAFAAVFFRRNLVQVKNPGGLWDESLKLYPLVGARPTHNLEWNFPTGAKVKFGHLEHETTVMDWQGAAIPMLGFDELTHFSAQQFWYMLSRNRSTCGVLPYVRATTNPDPDSWVATFIAWWIDQETGYPIPERSGIVRWFVRIADTLIWADSRAELIERFPDAEPKSATFIAAKLADNQILMQADPGYRANLMALSSVERERLLNGNWKIRQSGGLFKREWFEIVESVPPGPAKRCRAWDLAGTEKKVGNNPDWTVGARAAKIGDNFYVEDVARAQESTGDVQLRLKRTAAIDGLNVRIRIPQDPGQAGKAQAETHIILLAGYDVIVQPVSGDKETRARPMAALAEHGKIKLVRGHWNNAFLDELCGFPSTSSGAHDDQVDASADAINELALGIVHTSSVTALRV